RAETFAAIERAETRTRKEYETKAKSVALLRDADDLIRRSQFVSELTEGAFDISYASMDRLWQFDGSMTALPDSIAVEHSVRLINYQDVETNTENLSVFLRKPGMRIGFGAIGKGFAAKQVMDQLKSQGVKSGVVNAGGDLVAWGRESESERWKVAIRDPKTKGGILAWLEIEDQAVVTSGDYERFAIIDGQRYAHIIDPRSGYPVQGVKSCTVIGPDPELCDALATAFFVMGPEKAIPLAEQFKGIEVLFVLDNNTLKQSAGLKLQRD
ncbi:MAG: FAD:protein FMN transferase, partial [Bacteroidota bacterium]